MSKKTVLWIILNSIFLILFNTFFFILGGTEHNVSVWISYGFIHFAYFMLLFTPILMCKGKRSDVFGLSIYSVSIAYFIIALVAGIIFILVAPEGNNAALLVQLCITGFYGIVLISSMIANERTADAEEKRQYEIAFVKDASARLKSLLDQTNDNDVKKGIEKAYDAVYSSQVKSHPDLVQIENQILQSINELEKGIISRNKEHIVTIARTIVVAINERNTRLKSLN